MPSSAPVGMPLRRLPGVSVSLSCGWPSLPWLQCWQPYCSFTDLRSLGMAFRLCIPPGELSLRQLAVREILVLPALRLSLEVQVTVPLGIPMWIRLRFPVS